MISPEWQVNQNMLSVQENSQYRAPNYSWEGGKLDQISCFINVFMLFTFYLYQRGGKPKILSLASYGYKTAGQSSLLSTLKSDTFIALCGSSFHKKDTLWHIHVQMTQTEVSTHRTAPTHRYNLQIDSRKNHLARSNGFKGVLNYEAWRAFESCQN